MLVSWKRRDRAAKSSEVKSTAAFWATFWQSNSSSSCQAALGVRLGTHSSIPNGLLAQGDSVSNRDTAKFVCRFLGEHNRQLLLELVAEFGEILPNQHSHSNHA